MTIQYTPILGLPYPQSTDSADVPRDFQALATKLDPPSGNGVFIIGEIRFIAVAAPPGGWLVADGRAVSRTTYAKLFAAIAGMFGPGDGSTTFNLPDLRGRAVCGAGQGVGLANRAAGASWGVEAVKLTDLQSGANRNGQTGGMSANNPHFHYISAYPDASGGILAITNLANASVANAAATQSTDINHGHALVARDADAAHENTQPSIAIPGFIYSGA